MLNLSAIDLDAAYLLQCMTERSALRYAPLYLGKRDPRLDQYLGPYDPTEDITEPVPFNI